MAEALINCMGEGRYSSVSAGSFPTGFVHPRAIATLARHGIGCDQPRSQSWDDFLGESFDLLITVCDQAASESCPVYAGPCTKLHWSIADPAGIEGSDIEMDQAFDHAFALLKTRIESELL